jgi:hypothetical protein
MPQYKFVNIKCIQRRISDLFRDKVVQYFVEICRFEICRSKKICGWHTLEICSKIWKCGWFKWVLKLKKYSCVDSSMVEHLLVIDIIACHFLPIAQYKSLHVNLRWLGMRVQSQANFLNLLLHFWVPNNSLSQQMVPARLPYCYLHLAIAD